VTVCECERSTGATLAQVLLLANSDEIENKIAAGEGRVARLVKDKIAPAAAIEELYLTAFSRRPTPAEAERALAHVTASDNTTRGLEDILWTILNSKEFLFNH
jgi:hypothetical protein